MPDLFLPIEINFFEDISQLYPLLGEGTAVFVDPAVFLILKKDDKFCAALSRSVVIADILANPTVEYISKILLRLKNEPKIRKITAIGGGSAIDTAKAVSAFYYSDITSEAELAQAIADKNYINGYSALPITALPTTAGTGSEVTKWATVWDLTCGKKLSVDHPDLCPVRTVILPALTLSVPKTVTLSTGLDALSHAMEAFWAKKSDPLVREIALLAISKIRDYLPKVMSDLHNLKYREQMCRAALLAGIAFSRTRTTACHSISYPLTLSYGVPHGFAAAATLAPVMKINKTAVPEIAEIEALFPDGFDSWIADVCAGNINLALSAFGIEESEIKNIAEQTFTAGRMDNNPVDIKIEQVIEILTEVL